MHEVQALADYCVQARVSFTLGSGRGTLAEDGGRSTELSLCPSIGPEVPEQEA